MDENISSGSATGEANQIRETTAFYATRAAAEKVARELEAAGFNAGRVRIEPSAQSDAGLVRSEAEDDAGGPSQGFVVRVSASEADAERVSAILEDDATLAMDEQGAAAQGAARAASSGNGKQPFSRGRGSEYRRSIAHAQGGGANGGSLPSLDGVVEGIKDQPLRALAIAFGIGLVVGLTR